MSEPPIETPTELTQLHDPGLNCRVIFFAGQLRAGTLRRCFAKICELFVFITQWH